MIKRMAFTKTKLNMVFFLLLSIILTAIFPQLMSGLVPVSKVFASAPPTTTTDYQIPAGAEPWGTAFDKNGNIWVAVPGCDPSPTCSSNTPPGYLEEFNPAASAWIATYQLPAGYTQPLFLAFDKNGNLWFPLFMGNSIGTFNTSTHAFQQFIVPTANSGPWDIAIDKNGIIWFTEHFVNQIGRFDPVAKAFTEIATPATNSQPYGITVDRSNNIWFTENNPAIALIAEYTTSGVLKEYKIRTTLPGNSLTPHLITVDTNGNIWWTEGFVGMLGRLLVNKAVAGTNTGVSEYAYPAVCSTCGEHTSGISVDNNGLVWFDDSLQGIYGSFPQSGTGTFSTYNSPSPFTHPHDGLQVDKLNRIWFDEEFANKIAKVIQGNIIGEDIFLRPNQTFWGTANDGQTWAGQANTSSVFSIAGSTGKITNGNSTYNAVLGVAVGNSQVLLTGKMNSFTNGSIGAVLHYTDANNLYSAVINGTSLMIQKKVNGTITTLGSAAFTANANTFYTIRFQISGTTLSAKVWQAGKNEPVNWKINVTDSSFASGSCGLQATESSTSAVFTSFTASVF